MVRRLQHVTSSYRRQYGALAAHLPELMAVKAGLKRVLQITLGDEQAKLREEQPLTRWSNQAGLVCRFYVRRGLHKVIISQDPIEPPGDHEDENKDNRFCYPDCCVASFNANPAGYHTVRRIRELLEHGRQYPFVVNPFLSPTPFHLLGHHPCSLTCSPTIASTTRLFQLITARAPALARGIQHWNRRPVLFTDVCGIGLCFDGTLRDSVIRYRSCDWVGVPAELVSLAPETTQDDLRLFDKITAAALDSDELELGSWLRFRRNAGPIVELALPAHLAMCLVDFR